MAETLLSLAEKIGRGGVAQPEAPTLGPATAAAAPQGEEEDGGILSTVGDMAAKSITGAANLWKSAGGGIAKAGFEAKDFLFGEPEESEKWDIRRDIERRSDDLRALSPANGIVESTSQFVTGMIGVGKLTAPIKVLQKLKTAGAAGRLAYETARGAATSAVVFDPYQERLSDLVQQYEVLENPVTEFLASDPNDSAAMGRLKNALEGIGMDLAVAGGFALTIKALGLARRGDQAAAIKVLQEAEAGPAPAPDVPTQAAVASSVPDGHTRYYYGSAVPDHDVTAQDELWVTPHKNYAENYRRDDGGSNTLWYVDVPNDQLGELGVRDEINGFNINGKLPKEWAARAKLLDGDPTRPSAGAVGDASEVAATEISPVRSEASAIPATKNQPVWSPNVKVDEADASQVVKAYEEDTALLQKFGSRQEALAQGARLSNYNIPWQKIGSSDDLDTLVAATAQTLRSRMDAAKGGAILTDAKVQQLVRDAAEMFGDDPGGLMGELARSGDAARDMVANMEASYIISRRLFEDAHDAALKARIGLFDSIGGTPEAAQAEVVRRFQAAADMMAAGNSMRSNAGRSLRRLRQDFAITGDDVNAMRSLPPDKLMEVIYRSGGDIKKLRQAANPSWLRRALDEANFALTNNLLWFYPTHLVNTTTNLYMLAARPLEKWIGGVAMGTRGSAIRRQAQMEFAYTVNSLGDAWSAMVEAFRRGDSVLSPHQTEAFEQGSRVNASPIQWKPVKDIWDLFHNAYSAVSYHNIIGLPTRSLGAVDEFVKTLRYRAVVQARAAVEASDAGLSGPALKSHIQARLDDAFLPDGRALDSTALYEAQVSTFSQELLSGTVGAGVRNFRHNVPAVALILPFVKTPVNVLRYAWKMTPGLNLIQTEYRQMLTGALGPEAQAHAVGQMAMGSLFMALAANLAAGGRITGGGPSDPGLKKQLLGSGWQPYSIVIDNDDGSKTYVPLGRFDPVGMPFGMVADIVDMTITHPNTKDAEKGALAVGVSLAKAFSEKTFLLNVNQLLQAITEPERNMGRFAGGLAGNIFVPGASGVRGYLNDDPYMREARGFLDNAMKGLPGYSEGLPPQRDAFGNPLWRKRSLSTSQELDVVEAEHQRIIMETGYGINPPAPSRNGVDLRDVTLSDGRNAYDLLQELAANPGKGRSMEASLAKLIGSKAYQGLVDGPAGVKGTKLDAIAGVVSEYREAAFKALLKKYPELRAQVHQRQLQVKSALSANRGANSGPTTNVRQLLKDMGY